MSISDLGSGALLALGAAIIGGLLWLIRVGFSSAVRREFAPLTEKLVAHMDQEAADRISIAAKLDNIAAQFQQNAVEHAAFNERLHQIEQRGHDE